MCEDLAQKTLLGRAILWAETCGERAGSMKGPRQAVSIIEGSVKKDFLWACSPCVFSFSSPAASVFFQLPPR